jgi:hypothetical protein
MPRLTLCERDRPERGAFSFRIFRVELLIRMILTRRSDDDAWPLVRPEFVKAVALRSRLRKAGWWKTL